MGLHYLAVIVQLICTFVFTYAKAGFFHNNFFLVCNRGWLRAFVDSGLLNNVDTPMLLTAILLAVKIDNEKM